eukprot:855629-Pleurochrysis_carterae.AAC.4
MALPVPPVGTSARRAACEATSLSRCVREAPRLAEGGAVPRALNCATSRLLNCVASRSLNCATSRLLNCGADTGGAKRRSGDTKGKANEAPNGCSVLISLCSIRICSRGSYAYNDEGNHSTHRHLIRLASLQLNMIDTNADDEEAIWLASSPPIGTDSKPPVA